MTQPDNRPRVFSVMPSRGSAHMLAAASHYCLPTRGAVEIIPGMSLSSLLTHGFNLMWATALNWHKAGIVDYFLMHHDDIEVRTHGWLDVMVAEMKRTGAAVLSVVQPIKDGSGNTSTAVDNGGYWAPRKLTLDEIGMMPETFCAADTKWPDKALLINTGLMLIDLSRPEWRSNSDRDGMSLADGDELYFKFHINDRIVQVDGELRAQVAPEDWNFSRLCASCNLPVYATRKIECFHHGDYGFSNQPTPKLDGHYFHEIEGFFDFQDVYREAIARTPIGGTIVEVGCWKGKSLSFLLVEAKKSGKGQRIIGVDNFEGSAGQIDLMQAAASMDIQMICNTNANRADYDEESWVVLKRTSLEAAANHKDASLDFVFLDASHDEQSVRADIKAWLPKVKPHGILAGHDYDRVSDPGVPRAVDALLKGVKVKGRCWWYEVKGK